MKVKNLSTGCTIRSLRLATMMLFIIGVIKHLLHRIKPMISSYQNLPSSFILTWAAAESGETITIITPHGSTCTKSILGNKC